MKKVNLHILERCNFHCVGCFAHFKSKGTKGFDFWVQVLDNLKSSNMVSAVNFAGGEPLLHEKLSKLIKYSKKLEFKVSVITNGFYVNQKWLDENAGYLDCLGFSLDSLDEGTSIALGRCTRAKEVFGADRLAKVCEYIRANGFKTKIKINTVVSRKNYREKFVHKIADLEIDRWKILKLKVFDNGKHCNSMLAINDEEFEYFVQNNQYKNAVVEKSMVNSYLMVDANGNLVDNSNYDYKVVGSAFDESFEELYSRYEGFDSKLYAERY